MPATNQNEAPRGLLYHRRLVQSVLLCLIGLILSVASAADQATGALSAVHVGNSHSHPLRLLVPLTAQAGHTGYKEGHVNILGASLRWNWDHANQNKWDQTLAPANKWDAMVLLSWADDDATYAPKFAGEVYKGNPQCQVYIYVIWPDSNMSFDKPPPIRTEAHGEAVAVAVAAAFPTALKPRVIPSSLLIRELGRFADMGELPGVANRFALFSDGGHLSQFGQYAVTTMVCAMLYGESPQDYPSDIFRKDEGGRPIRSTYQCVTVSEDTALAIKRTVWDILQTYEPAGMKPGLVIANRRLDVAIAGQPYKAALKALNAKDPCVWSLSKGTLPEGISLSVDGTISGQSKAVGQYPVTVKLATGKDALERPLVLSVNKDTPPAIPDQPLPAVSLDTYVFQPIKVEGGVGTIKWSVSNGELPFGILLASAGMLNGTPGEEGEFTFTIKAEDSHPAGPRTAEKELRWKIGPALPDSLQVKYVIKHDQRIENWRKIPEDNVVKIDGKLDEPFWNLDQAIEKKVQGTPVKKASFSAVWTAYCQGNGPKPNEFVLGTEKGRTWALGGEDLVIAIKVLDGPKGKTVKDGVHIYVDGRHDRKLIYGADDIHFFVPRSSKIPNGWAPIVRGVKPPWFSKVAVAEIAGGYTVEVSLGSPNLIGDGQWLTVGARSVYGLDIAVDEGDDKEISQQVWRGDANDAEDTSHFGTIVLTAQPAMAPQQPGAK
ncbi:MAG: putative Ig domain-containing protein [Planctomycetota bacterium]